MLGLDMLADTGGRTSQVRQVEYSNIDNGLVLAYNDRAPAQLNKAVRKYCSVDDSNPNTNPKLPS